MEGNYLVGFFDMINHSNATKVWHKFTYHEYLHEIDRAHCMLAIIGDYCMYYKKRSDIAYQCSETIMGYAIQCKDWYNIEKCCLNELVQGFKTTAMRKYYN
jgi:hypothetical protein